MDWDDNAAHMAGDAARQQPRFGRGSGVCRVDDTDGSIDWLLGLCLALGGNLVCPQKCITGL